MKKATILFAMAGLLLASSCTRIELFPSDPREWNGTKATLKLAVKSADSPKTKAETTRPGDDDGNYNENKIYTLDYFIFNVDPTANSNSGTDAVIKGRLSFNGIEPTTEELALEYAKTIDVSEKFGENNNTCYVYVIANLPDATSSPDNYFEINEDGDLQHVAGTTTTVLEADYATLQAIEVVTHFNKSLTDGKKFKPQKSFVMSGLKGPITLTGTGADEAIVDIGRIASKISLDINVIKMIEQYSTNNVTQDEVYQGTWFPNVDHIQIYLNYVNPAGLVSGAYEGRKYEVGPYFSYERNAYQSSIKNGTYTSTSLARYSADPNSEFYWGKVSGGTEELVGQIYVDGSGNPVLINDTTYPAFEVTGTPFYSYPTMWKTSDATAPFIKIIIPWVKYSVVESYRKLSPDNQKYSDLINAVQGFPNETTNLTYTFNEASYPVATRVTTASAMNNRHGEEFYYKISVPAFLDNPYVYNNQTYECALIANKWYMINLDVAVLGSETDDAEMTIDGSQMGIYVVDWSTPDEDLGGTLDGGRYLSTAQKEYVINAVGSTTIPVTSSHTLVAEIISKKVLVNGVLKDSWTSKGANGNTITHTLTNRGTVTPNGTSSITVSNALNSTVGPNLDCYPFVFTIRISQKNSDGTTTDSMSEVITVYQYPSIYVDNKAGGNVMIDGYFGNVNVGGSAHYHASYVYNDTFRYNGRDTRYSQIYGSPYEVDASNNRIGTPYGPLTCYADRQQDMTVISISSVSGLSFDLGTLGSFDYVIADPRQKGDYTSNSLEPHFSGNWDQNNNNTTRWTDGQASGIMIGNTETKNFIAPRFMISSRWGRMGNWTDRSNSDTDNLNDVKKRCATYQEAGYPAGRWRLPTDAEIMFIAKLQQNGFIDELFSSSGHSFSASGDVFTVTSSGVSVNQNRGTSCRCVYDLWYWGDNPVQSALSTYTIAVQ